MKTSLIQVIGGLSDDLPASTDPAYQNAALCLMLRKQLENLEANGFSFNAVETTDFTTFNTDMNTFLANANQRFDEWLQGQVATVAANLPDVLSIGAAYVSGGATEVGGLILQRVLGHLFHQTDSYAEHEGVRTDIDTEELENKITEVVNKLEEVRVQIATILTEFNINIVKSDEEATFSVGFPEEP